MSPTLEPVESRKRTDIILTKLQEERSPDQLAVQGHHVRMPRYHVQIRGDRLRTPFLGIKIPNLATLPHRYGK